MSSSRCAPTPCKGWTAFRRSSRLYDVRLRPKSRSVIHFVLFHSLMTPVIPSDPLTNSVRQPHGTIRRQQVERDRERYVRPMLQLLPFQAAERVPPGLAAVAQRGLGDRQPAVDPGRAAALATQVGVMLQQVPASRGDGLPLLGEERLWVQVNADERR